MYNNNTNSVIDCLDFFIFSQPFAVVWGNGHNRVQVAMARTNRGSKTKGPNLVHLLPDCVRVAQMLLTMRSVGPKRGLSKSRACALACPLATVRLTVKSQGYTIFRTFATSKQRSSYKLNKIYSKMLLLLLE